MIFMAILTIALGSRALDPTGGGCTIPVGSCIGKNKGEERAVSFPYYPREVKVETEGVLVTSYREVNLFRHKDGAFITGEKSPVEIISATFEDGGFTVGGYDGGKPVSFCLVDGQMRPSDIRSLVAHIHEFEGGIFISKADPGDSWDRSRRIRFETLGDAPPVSVKNPTEHELFLGLNFKNAWPVEVDNDIAIVRQVGFFIELDSSGPVAEIPVKAESDESFQVIARDKALKVPFVSGFYRLDDDRLILAGSYFLRLRDDNIADRTTKIWVVNPDTWKYELGASISGWNMAGVHEGEIYLWAWHKDVVHVRVLDDQFKDVREYVLE